MAPHPGGTVQKASDRLSARPPALQPQKAGEEVRKGEVFYSWGRQGQNTQSLWLQLWPELGREVFGAEREAVTAPGWAPSLELWAEGPCR